MKNRLLTLTFLLITSALFGQDRGYIGISIGPSIPIGELASKDFDNDAAGFAGTGATFDLSFAYKLNSKFGITAVLHGQSNPVDAQAMADEVANAYPGVLWTVTTGSWGIGGLLFGGYGSFPISEKTSFETKAMIGFLNSSSPSIMIEASTNTGSEWIKQSAAGGSSFAYSLGLGFKFNLGKKICLLTSIDYIGGKPEFRNVEYTDSDGDRELETFSQKFGAINFSGGIGFRL